jgi:hypothetical protein
MMASRKGWLKSQQFLLSAAILVVLAGIGIALVAAPLFRPYSAAECAAAYAEAHTRGDTARIDLRRHRSDVGLRNNERCGSVRAVASQPAAGILTP